MAEDEVSCIKEEDKEEFKKALVAKKDFLVEELNLEQSMHDKTGLYSGRDSTEIKEDLDKVKLLLSKIDDLPLCGVDNDDSKG